MQNALITFIKNPIRGQGKTRLAADVGDEKALRIYLALMDHTRKVAQQVHANRYLFYDQYIDTADSWSSLLFQKHLQSDGDLGARMENAFSLALQQHQKVMIIGSDCAQLTPDIISHAFESLNNHDVVIGPALDGGYYLIGMKRLYPFLFQDMPWSSDTVFTETQRRIKQHNLSWDKGPTLSDIDYATDWETYGWTI
ncbi:MAG: glycosyltransferase [Saprospiraceae bacterium]|nr:glycosyltransferase [Saprospiraceae bacterium]